MQLIRKKPLIFIFLLGFLLRLSLMFVDFSFDVNNHIIWAKDLHIHGFQGFYDTPSSEMYATAYPNYPPLAMFLFYLFYPLPKIIFTIAWWLNVHIPLFPSKLVYFFEGRSFLAGVLKLPAIVADMGLAWLSYLFAKRLTPKSKEIQLLAPALILFNPVFFYNSAFWGQIDVIPLVFALLAYYLLLFSDRFILSGVIFTLSLLVKPTTLIFLPIYMFFFIQKFGMRNFVKMSATSLIVFWLSFLPFLKNPIDVLSPFTIYWHKIIEAQSLPYVTNSAFNSWLLIVDFKDAVKDTAPFIFGISYRIIGYSIVGALSIVILYRSLKIKDKLSPISTTSFFIAFAAFLFLTKMHERYFMLPLPFLLLTALKEKRLMRWFYTISLLAFLNLYHSWAVPFIKPVFALLDNPAIYILLSAGSVIIFCYLFVRFVNKKG